MFKKHLILLSCLNTSIEIKMSETEYDSRQILAAQVLYVTMLSEQASDPGFIDKLVGCFSAEQTDTQLIVNINLAFGTDISADEFTKFMSSIHKRIVSVALSQLGNEGGELFWSWYGFESRVEWCACFVSWCADQCGYLDSGQIPKFAGCGIGVDWFKEHDQWLDGGETPSSGMIIFFDWNDEDGQDGWSDHVGIVEKVENGYVYTIEGNSGDRQTEAEKMVEDYNNGLTVLNDASLAYVDTGFGMTM